MDEGITLHEIDTKYGNNIYNISGADQEQWPLKLWIQKNPLSIGSAIRICKLDGSEVGPEVLDDKFYVFKTKS